MKKIGIGLTTLAVLLTQGTKRFHGHTIMTQDKGKVGSWFKEKTSSFKRADLVDPEFEKLFDVFTTDQVEARYLIDPRIIENLKTCLLYTSPSPRDRTRSRMPSSA